MQQWAKLQTASVWLWELDDWIVGVRLHPSMNVVVNSHATASGVMAPMDVVLGLRRGSMPPEVTDRGWMELSLRSCPSLCQTVKTALCVASTTTIVDTRTPLF